jgi:catechol 2,3-dioxygenase-like lactoylglutathione lyase family enzyme
MPLAHVSLAVSDLEASTAFYLEILKPLDYGLFMKIEGTTGMGVKYAGPDFWIHKCPEAKKKTGVSATHVAFKGKNRKVVQEFYDNAL